jgi:hypothetical protein
MFSAVRFIRVTMLVRVTRDIFTVTTVVTMIRPVKITCVKRVY